MKSKLGTLKIERSAAEKFLRVYNARTGTQFEIVEHSDSPDLRCRDRMTGELLDLEITLLEDVHGDARYKLGRGPRQGVRCFNQDTLSQFKERVTDKCNKDYGPHAALVMVQVADLWTTSDWEMYLDDFQAVIPSECKHTFTKGVWVLTWKDDDGGWLKDKDIVKLL
jgi:hypothetical protein